MLIVLPTASAIRPSSYLTPQPYHYCPNQGCYRYPEAPQFAVPHYPAPRPPLFYQSSAEELEENEYRRALEVVANHRRRQAAEEATMRRQQQAEAARQRYFAILAAELEQQRQEELFAARRAEVIRSRQAQARLAASERQHALSALLLQLGGAQPATRQPHIAKRKPITDALTQRLAAESDPDITEPIRNILSNLEHPAQSEKPKDAREDAAKLIQDIVSSIFPGSLFHTQPQRVPSTDQASVSNKGKGKARAVDVEEPRKPMPKPESAGEAFADIIRHVMELSKSTPVPRSPDEAGPSGPSSLPPSLAKPTVSEREQAQIDRAVALSSVEHVQDTLVKLQADFVLPPELDHYTPSTDDRDETASVSSASSSDLVKLIPYTSTNKPVYKYENELNGLLEELDRVESHGDAEVREKRKEVVKAIEKALEGVEHVISEAVEKRLSVTSTTTPAADRPLEGFNVDDITEEFVPAPEQVDTPVVVGGAAVSEPLVPVQVEETVGAPAEVSSPAAGALPESDTPIACDQTTHVPAEPTSAEPDVEASSATITPAELTSMPGTDLIESQVPADAPETADTFLLPEKVSSPSPVEKPQEIDSDADEEVLVLDSDAEKSDWSELEH